MTNNPFKNKNAEETLEMFIESPSHETKKISVYASAIQVKSTQEVKEIISDLKVTMDYFTQVIKTHTESTNRSTSHMFWLTVVLAVAAIVQALSAFAQWKVSENAIEVQRDANRIENSRWQYEIWRDDRLESRDVQWRQQDIQQMSEKANITPK
jgi:hypothetical protein